MRNVGTNRQTLIILKIVEELAMGSFRLIFLANSLEVDLRRIRLPSITPNVDIIAWSIPTRFGCLSYLIASASREIS